MKIGVIIRTTGERTEKLCNESASLLKPSGRIHVVKNHYPFWKAVEKTMKLAMAEKFDYFFALDADIILRKDCKIKLEEFFATTDISKVYRVDFPIKERFTKKLLYGIHFYNGKYCKQVLDALEKTKLSSKPEGDIKNHIECGEIKADWALGYHGYEQFHTDIFNRFVLRAYRNPEFVKRYEMFQGEDDETKIAKFGWRYGLTLGKSGVLNLDASNKINIAQFGYSEISPLKMNIETFHKKWSNYAS